VSRTMGPIRRHSSLCPNSTRERSFVSTLLAALGTLGYYGAYAVIIYLTVTGYRSPAGPFTIGVLTFLAGSFRQSRDLIQRVLLSLSQVFEQSLYLDDLFSFLELEPGIPPRGRLVPLLPAGED